MSVINLNCWMRVLILRFKRRGERSENLAV